MTFNQLPKSILLSLLGSFALSLQAQVVVIVSAKNPVTKMTVDQVTQIFLGQSSTFITGGKAEPLDLADRDAARAEFCNKILGKSPAQVKAHWSKQAFSGKGQPPASMGSAAEMVSKVAENPKYIGYVEKSAVTGSVKVLTIQ